MKCTHFLQNDIYILRKSQTNLLKCQDRYFFIMTNLYPTDTSENVWSSKLLALLSETLKTQFLTPLLYTGLTICCSKSTLNVKFQPSKANKRKPNELHRLSIWDKNYRVQPKIMNNTSASHVERSNLKGKTVTVKAKFRRSPQKRIRSGIVYIQNTLVAFLLGQRNIIFNNQIFMAK